MRIRASTRLIAVVGDPVAQSLSPAMHNAAIAALGLDAVYVALRSPAGALEGVVEGLLAVGGAVNVTVPHKRAAALLVDDATDRVRRTGACNSIWPGPAGFMGDNTDVPGVRVAAKALVPLDTVRTAMIIGTGGSARAAAVGLAEEWPEVAIEVISRDAERAAEFARWAEGAGVTCRVGGHGQPDLLVNATPLGLVSSDPLPIERDLLQRTAPKAVLDLAYARGGTVLVRAAKEGGAVATDGRGVLVEQGAAAFRHFFGVAAPIEIMRAAVEDALRP